MEFKVGDIVEAFGCRGEVSGIYRSYGHLPLAVKFVESCSIYNFTLDGKAEQWHKEPSLKLIERPKKMVKRTDYFVFSFRSNELKYNEFLIFSTMKEAEVHKDACGGVISEVSYEVEE